MIWVELLSRHRDVAGRFRVERAEITIGRGYDNDVIVDDPYVAARHLRIFRDAEGRLVAEDLGSANGTFVNRKRLEPHVKTSLRNGDYVQTGTVMFVVRY